MTLLDLIRTQDGLVRHDQARERGLSPAAIGRRVAAGEWLEIHPRVYLAATHDLTARARLRAAALWAGDDATLVGHAAAAWWGLTDRAVGTIEIAVGPGGGHRVPAGVHAVRRAADRPGRVLVDGVWVEHRASAALGAATTLGLVEGARLLDRALQQQRISVPSLRAALAAMGQRHGVVLARRLVGLAEGDARSEAERDAARSLTRAGIGGWTANLPVDLPGFGRVVIDIAFPAQRIAVEIDGWAFHRDVDRFRRDGLRQNEVVIGGWRVIRVSWYDLQATPGYLADAVRRALRAAAAA
ncbi:type IV toxin-antitoxin system AbiEi family antitoxin domain-containing protein [Actinomycetospora straminea]|uniref:Type IV toxin-antitoxin system AbiEi family antitoxin domain-containing protein n=1 Tax=Actinomycetospora straminea TaxID=663607 RepID=A0ABP9E8Z2_9PSEU|nr:type IV toxin-antitoxin system AbiEi family antitoxin domain-containing protein [Actinomycetospora straminea]MDD7935300.1 type IV toxin-antitoxin system AbiEi family antitoxin domain-containing protein [Actinomycetospora straminea]